MPSHIALFTIFTLWLVDVPSLEASDIPFSAPSVAKFVASRCGSADGEEGPAMWSYEGTLTDPLTGKVFAEVEGIELAKALPVVTPLQLTDGPSPLDKLCAKNLLYPKQGNPSSATLQWDTATTILSRRLFCYKRPSSGIESKQSTQNNFEPYKSLLTSLRLRPDGPLRYLSPIENIAIYDTAVTYITRNEGREMVIFSERGGLPAEEGEGWVDHTKHYLMGNAQSNAADGGSFHFTVHAQKGTIGRKCDQDSPMLPPLKLMRKQTGSEELVISPPRSRFLQFGKGDGIGSPSERKYGSVRETYKYSFEHAKEDDADGKPGFFGQIRGKMRMKPPTEKASQSQPKCIMRYSRYGEAPPWYAPGRSCMLELQGTRELTGEEGQANLPKLISWVVTKCNFWSGWPSICCRYGERNGKQIAWQALESFCNERQLSIGRIDGYPVADRNRWVASAENALFKMQICFGRLSKSFILSELPKTSLTP